MKRVQRTGSLPSSASTGPRRPVLYVEDDEENRLVASMRLEKKYQLLFAKNDREACETFIRHGSTLAIVLMDIELRGSHLTGIDLTRLIKGKLAPERRPPYAVGVPQLDVPVLFVTAYWQTHPRDELLAAGGEEVLSKPIDFVALHTAMTRVYINRMGP